MSKRLVCGIALGLVLCSVNKAADVDWTASAGDRLWSNPANWSSNQVPTASDVVFVDVPAALAPHGPILQPGVEARISGLVCEVTGRPTMTMTGGTLAISGYIWWGDGPGCFGTFYMSGGTVTTGQEFELGWGGGGGTWYMTGGTINAQELVIPTATGAEGTLYLYGGTCNVGNGGLSMSRVGLVDVGAGTLTLEGDHVNQINGLIANGQIIAYSGDGHIQVDYNVRNPGKTTVTAEGTRRASEPQPADHALDVPRDVVLSWTPGVFAPSSSGHIVYFGDSFDDVNDATDGAAQDTNRYVPDPALEFGKTYYWRVDEVNNAAPDTPVHRGEVWRFTTEPYAYPLENISATASSSQAGMGPENAINGSGLDSLDQHSTQATDMWMTTGAKPAWIQFEFDKVYKLYELWVWNSNQLVESFLGFGAKDVTLECSVDGQTWEPVEGVPPFSRATGMPTYAAGTTVDLGGAMAKFVRLTIDSNWGSAAPQTGLSEVRFFYIPVHARAPQPADGATGVSVEADLNWRPGREAESHEVYFGTDRNALTLAETAAGHSHTPASLEFVTEYFWKVNEVGGTGPYEGSVWGFTTEEFAAIDDMESYTDDVDAGTTIYQTWIDGLTDPAKGGSQVGYDVSPFAEQGVVHGGRQSLPLRYDNAAAPFYSEAERTFASPQDWTAHGGDTLCVYFQGRAASAGNSAEGLYLTVKDSSGKSKTVAHPDGAATTATTWQQWKIPLSEFAAGGVKVTAVKTLAIGVGNKAAPAAGGTGTVFLDDIGFGRPLQ